jgi:hypothetical protein
MRLLIALGVLLPQFALAATTVVCDVTYLQAGAPASTQPCGAAELVWDDPAKSNYAFFESCKHPLDLHLTLYGNEAGGDSLALRLLVKNPFEPPQNWKPWVSARGRYPHRKLPRKFTVELNVGDDLYAASCHKD